MDDRSAARSPPLRELAGFDSPDSCKFRSDNVFAGNSLAGRYLGHSSWSSLVPVVVRCKGHEPGQIRAKFSVWIPRRYPWGPYSPDQPMLAAISLSARKRRRRLRGAIYARFSTKFQQSIPDQIRECRAWAEENDIDVDDEHIFTDEAQSGRSHRRAGLVKMLEALAGDEVDVILTFATNRLYRKVYRALQFVNEEIVDRRKRCIFVAQRIDTEKTEQWKFLVQVFAMLDEAQVDLLGGQVRSAHQGLLLKNLIHGTISFGYRGKEVPGPLTKRGKPRREWAIDEDLAKWVRKSFNWFVHDGLGYSEIARELRKAKVKRPPRVERWTWRAVKCLLKNRRYIGDFSYGRTETVWQNRAGYSRQFEREEPRMAYINEALRIVDDPTFFAAEERIATYKGKGGRKKGDNREAQDHLLRGLLWCPTHNCALTVTGAHGRMMACPACKRQDEQALFSQVNRQLAERLICETLARYIKDDDDLLRQAKTVMQRHLQYCQEPDPSEIETLEREVKSTTTRIKFILNNPGETDTDRDENSKLLGTLRAERADRERRLAQLRSAAHQEQVRPPTDQELKDAIDRLGDVLAATKKGEEVDRIDVKNLIADLTGGRIQMSQQGEARRHHGWLRGTFRLHLLSTVLAGHGALPEAQVAGTPISIDFRPPAKAEAFSEKAKILYDRGRLVKQIAAELGISRAMAASALRHWFSSRGLIMPDGRSRRASLEQPALAPSMAKRIASDVRALCERGLLYVEIADRLGVNKDTVTAAVRYLRRSGVEIPDGRTRRTGLSRKLRDLRGSSGLSSDPTANANGDIVPGAAMHAATPLPSDPGAPEVPRHEVDGVG